MIFLWNKVIACLKYNLIGGFNIEIFFLQFIKLFHSFFLINVVSVKKCCTLIVSYYFSALLEFKSIRKMW